MYKFFLVVAITYFLGTPSWGHGDKKHDAKVEEVKKESVSKITDVKINKINNLYLNKVRPIFKNKCFNCHGKVEKLPWYSVIPGPKQIIEHDISEAKEHMDMSNDIPFGGHGELREDLESLLESLNNDTMPPWKYLLLHWKSSLTLSEKKIIKNWIQSSLEILN